jgi:hypothetical protein
MDLGQRSLDFGLGPEALLPDEGLLKPDRLNGDGQGQGEESNGRHPSPRRHTG